MALIKTCQWLSFAQRIKFKAFFYHDPKVTIISHLATFLIPFLTTDSLLAHSAPAPQPPGCSLNSQILGLCNCYSAWNTLQCHFIIEVLPDHSISSSTPIPLYPLTLHTSMHLSPPRHALLICCLPPSPTLECKLCESREYICFVHCSVLRPTLVCSLHLIT